MFLPPSDSFCTDVAALHISAATLIDTELSQLTEMIDYDINVQHLDQESV